MGGWVIWEAEKAAIYEVRGGYQSLFRRMNTPPLPTTFTEQGIFDNCRCEKKVRENYPQRGEAEFEGH